MMANWNPGTFIQEVRQQMAKVVWPTRREAFVTTGIVFVFVSLAALFFLMVDQVFSFVVRALLQIGIG